MMPKNKSFEIGDFMQGADNSVSIIIVTYNSIKYIDNCIKSILVQRYNFEIIVIDNCSTDGTCEYVSENFPSVNVIKNSGNFGYGNANNLGVKYATRDIILIINPDTIMEDGSIESLLSPLLNTNKLITTPKILTYNSSIINSCGHINHFTGLGFTRGFGAEPSAYQRYEYVCGAPGTCFAMKRIDFIELGGFDETFFMYREDGDLVWRAHLNNIKILYVPTSVIRHDYKLKVTPKKLYHIEKGRYLILKKYFSVLDFMFLSPSLFLTEILSFGYATRLGVEGLLCKLSSMKYILFLETCKVRGNKLNLINNLSYEIPVDQLTFNPADKILKKLFNKMYKLNFYALKFVYTHRKKMYE